MVQFEFDINWPRTAWIGFGVLLACSLIFVIYRFVGTFVFGIFIYYATRRLYRRVRRHVSQPSVASALSLLLLFLPAILLLYYTVGIALKELQNARQQLQATSQADLQPYMDVLNPYLELSNLFSDPVSALASSGSLDVLSASLQASLGYAVVLGTGLLHLFVMFALAFYLLRDSEQFARWGQQLTDTNGVLDHYFEEVDKSLDKVFYGNILNAGITGLLGAIAFSTVDLFAPTGLGVPYPALTGLLAGIASLIPVVGMKLIYVPLTLYLGVLAVLNGDGWWFVALFGGIAFTVVDTIPDIVVRPYVSGGSLHVGSLMFAYILGPLIFGWYGIFLGPMLLVVIVHFARIVAPELIRGTPVKPTAIDPEAMADSSQASEPLDPATTADSGATAPPPSTSEDADETKD
jgi:predicted PurR-regulated permease PerM